MCTILTTGTRRLRASTSIPLNHQVIAHTSSSPRHLILILSTRLATANLTIYAALVVLALAITHLHGNALPALDLGPGLRALLLELVARAAELRDGLLGEQLLQRPLFDVLRLVLLELGDELYGALQDRALVLLAARHNLGELVDAFVDGFAAAPFHLGV